MKERSDFHLLEIKSCCSDTETAKTFHLRCGGLGIGERQLLLHLIRTDHPRELVFNQAVGRIGLRGMSLETPAMLVRTRIESLGDWLGDESKTKPRAPCNAMPADQCGAAAGCG